MHHAECSRFGGTSCDAVWGEEKMKVFTTALAGAALLAAFSTGARAAPLEVFACVPEWASLAKSLGGDRIGTVTLATTPFDNPDNLKPTPGQIAALGRADLMLCTGAGLEEAWLPAMLERANNRSSPRASPAISWPATS